jgi:hypothetical protein
MFGFQDNNLYRIRAENLKTHMKKIKLGILGVGGQVNNFAISRRVENKHAPMPVGFMMTSNIRPSLFREVFEMPSLDTYSPLIISAGFEEQGEYAQVENEDGWYDYDLMLKEVGNKKIDNLIVEAEIPFLETPIEILLSSDNVSFRLRDYLKIHMQTNMAVYRR